LAIEEFAPDFWRATARYGFMEKPDVPGLLRQAHERGCDLDLDDLTYYVGHETVVPRTDGPGLPRFVSLCYAFLQRNSLHVSDYLNLPTDSVVEIGRHIGI
jgi:KUP system potassium uptake protein